MTVAAASEHDADWRRALHVQRLAADAGPAPRVLHIDDARRAVLTAFVADRSFPAFYRDPRTHAAALVLLGRMVGRLHAIAIPADVNPADPRAFLAQVWGGLRADFRRSGLCPRRHRRCARGGGAPEGGVPGHAGDRCS
jgi:hypothetical protein